MLSAQATPVYAHSASSSSSPCPSPIHHHEAAAAALYQHPTNNLLAKVKRSDSLRSEEETDQSSSAENRRVSFNADVTVKKIPKSRLIGGNRGAGLIDAASRPTFSTFKPDDIDTGPFARNITKEEPPANARAIASEAEKILRQLEGVECTTSRTSLPPPPIPAVRSLSNSFNAASHPPPPPPPPPHLRPLQPPPIHPKPKFVLSSFRGGGESGGSTTPTQNKFIAAGGEGGSATLGAQTSQRSNNPNVAHVEAATARARNKVGGDGANVQGVVRDNGELFSSTVSNSSSSGVSSGSGGAAVPNGNSYGGGRAIAAQTTGHGGSSGIDSGGGVSPVEDSKATAGQASADGANAFYGLHALNNLDIAVNGKDVNAMPSYQEVRRRQGNGHGNLDSSGGSAEYSPPQPRRSNNNVVSPPKPPRKAPSQSPPSMRRSEHAHYARPAADPATGRSSKMVSSMMEQLSQDSRFRRHRMAMETSGDEDLSSTYAVPPARPARRGASPATQAQQQHQSSLNRRGMRPDHHAISPSRVSPSRTCLTDTELLRSPTEVLYAVSDKQRDRERAAMAASQSMASQTMQSELQNSKYHGGGAMTAAGKSRSRATSREDLLYGSSDNRSQYALSTRSAGPYGGSRQQHNGRGGDENGFKARIHVISPDRVDGGGGRGGDSRNGGGGRKPFKTMINTATDNIVNVRGDVARSIYQKNNQIYRRPESEHYKVPKNKAPIEFAGRNGMMHRPSHLATDSDHSTVNSYYGGGGGGRQPFNASKLVQNAPPSRHHRGYNGGRELDREGRAIRRSDGAAGRGRTYSGCSTSPDREGSPEGGPGGGGRYSRPNSKPAMVRSHSNMHRSPSTSPTRPPRSRSSPGREIISNVVRRVTRTPSNRATATSHSPIKEIKRVQQHNGHVAGHGHSRTMPRQGSYPPVAPGEEDEERFSRFTEYRGAGGNGSNTMGHGGRRESSYDNRPPSTSRQYVNSADEALSSRERGRSLPPGANIDSMRDFYKSSQFKSMYALPPSPTRPAPVLERAPSSSTLVRQGQPPRPVRPTRVSISEGEFTDDPMRQHLNPAAVVRQQSRAGANPGVRYGVVKRQSTKRQAPSPPGRRVVSSDREERLVANGRGGAVYGSNGHHPESNYRRVASSDRVQEMQQHPPARKQMMRRRTSMGDALDSSYSESEGLPDQEKPLSEFGRRWNGNGANSTTDMDSDYRRDMAGLTTMHHEARGRDGGAGGASTLQRRQRVRGRPGDSSADASPVAGARSSSAREEERRKVVEIENKRRMAAGLPVSRSSSRVSRATGAAQSAPPPSSRLIRQQQQGAVDPYDSQYSSSTAPNPAAGGGAGRVIRVKRSTSNAANNNNPLAGTGMKIVSGGGGGVGPRKKIPTSLGSSLNSSESENNNGLAAADNRKVFLHSACVADIPVEALGKRGPRAISADASLSGGRDAGSRGGAPPTMQRPQGPPQTQANLKNSKKLSRSISMLAPWKPKPVARQYQEIHYGNEGARSTVYNKPPRPPPTSVPPVTSRGPGRIQRDKKSASSSDLLHVNNPHGSSDPDEPQNQIGVIGGLRGGKDDQRATRTLHRAPANKSSGPPSSANASSSVSRSVSMPKDSRLAGWFRKKKRL